MNVLWVGIPTQNAPQGVKSHRWKSRKGNQQERKVFSRVHLGRDEPAHGFGVLRGVQRAFRKFFAQF